MPNYETFQHDQDLDQAATRVLFDHWTPSEVPYEPAARRTATMPPPVRPPSTWNVERLTRLASLARKIRYRGRLAARLDPLDRQPQGALGLDPIARGVTPEDLLDLPAGVVGGPAAKDAANTGAAIQSLLSIYCGTTGYDFGHVQAAEERAWFRDAVETGRYSRPLAAATQRQLLERLTETEAFERFLHRSKPGRKRFSTEGNDVLIPMLDMVIRSAALNGIQDIVVGIAHRGRLNVPAHMLAKPYAKIPAEFQTGAHGPTTGPTEHLTHDGWTGDVKYHLGAQKTFTEGETVCVRITPAANPSHLEFVNPVIQGMVRALQECRERPGMPELDTRTAPAILIHGDASFPGEGIVAETLNLSAPAGYQIAGAVHIIVNNQLGFTTDSAASRSTRYACDLAKGFEIPIVHVNADDPEASLAAAMPAYAYRERFQKDFLIDLMGYRRWGHNEGDLRRQVALRNVEPSPPVLMTLKSLLRHHLAASPLTAFTEGGFQPVIDDDWARQHRDVVTRLILCSGKVYVDLVGDGGRLEAERVAIARVEQLYPLPSTALGGVVDGYPNLREVIRLQEEPKNMGAWSYMAPRLRDLIGRVPRIDYVGRPDRASPAEGSPLLHWAEHGRIVAEAFSGLQGSRPVVSRAK